jgi:hypothetical protein
MGKSRSGWLSNGNTPSVCPSKFSDALDPPDPCQWIETYQPPVLVLDPSQLREGPGSRLCGLINVGVGSSYRWLFCVACVWTCCGVLTRTCTHRPTRAHSLVYIHHTILLAVVWPAHGRGSHSELSHWIDRSTMLIATGRRSGAAAMFCGPEDDDVVVAQLTQLLKRFRITKRCDVRHHL